jgi:methylmalonyl-CoA mutase, N-terminal domain
VQEVAFTLSNAVAYVEAALEAGLKVDEFAPRLSFFFACHMNFFEEAAKFRAARRMWARLMKERYGATERSMLLRFHTQTGGATLTAQQPENNIVRTAFEAMAAVLGGTQSLHTNSFDEALALPTERAAKIALRTQQVLAFESGVTDVLDPLGGSWYVESLTNEIEEQAEQLLKRIDDMGGSVAAVERGWMKQQIEESAYRQQQEIEADKRTVVGVNKFVEPEGPIEIYRPDPEVALAQIERTKKLRPARDQSAVDAALNKVRTAARGTENLLYPMREALSVYATLGEVCDVLREEFGTHEPRESF